MVLLRFEAGWAGHWKFDWSSRRNFWCLTTEPYPHRPTPFSQRVPGDSGLILSYRCPFHAPRIHAQLLLHQQMQIYISITLNYFLSSVRFIIVPVFHIAACVILSRSFNQAPKTRFQPQE